MASRMTLLILTTFTYLSPTPSTPRHKLTAGEALGDTGGSTSHCHTVRVSVKVALALVSGRHSGGHYTSDSRKDCAASQVLCAPNRRVTGSTLVAAVVVWKMAVSDMVCMNRFRHTLEGAMFGIHDSNISSTAFSILHFITLPHSGVIEEVVYLTPRSRD